MGEGEVMSDDEAARKGGTAMQQNEQRPDLDGRLPVVFNGKSAEEWYQLYSQKSINNPDDRSANSDVNMPERVKECAERIVKMRDDSNIFDGGYPATEEGRWQSLRDHAAVAEYFIFHSGLYRRRIEPQTFAEHVAEINELGLGYHGPQEKKK